MAPVKKPKKNFNHQEISDMQHLGINDENNSETENAQGEQDAEEVSKEVQVIAQEVKIVKALACNDLNIRQKQMKKLRKWLQLRSQSSFTFSEEDFVRIWKGLYYNMWYSDKPLVQEDLAEQYGKLLQCFEGKLELSVNFFGAFLKVMCIEWFGIDQWRIDKFLMLTRRMLRYMFKILKANAWDSEAVEIYNKHVTETVLFDNVTAKGLTMHYLDIFLEELSKVTEGEIASDQVALFIKPFVTFMATQKDFQLISHCRNRVFYHLLYQSDMGRDYSEKYQAWKDMGFPTKHIDDLERHEESDNEEDDGQMADEVEDEEVNNNKHLDPRAGNVDVFMPVLPLDADAIIKGIEQFLYKAECATKRRKMLKKLLEVFIKYENGEFPLGIKTMPRFEDKSEQPLIKDKIKHLDNLENELYGVDRKLKQLTKRKRRKLLKSLNYDEIDESNYEQKLEKAIPRDYLAERRKKSQKAFMSNWVEEELDETDLMTISGVEENGMGKENSVIVNRKSKKPKKKKINLESQQGDVEEPKKKQKRLDTQSQNHNNKQKAIIDNGENLNKQSKILTQETSVLKETKVLKISDDINETPKSKLKETKILKISDTQTEPKKNFMKTTKSLTSTPNNEWDEPLAEGEIEYFLPSRKLQAKKANSKLSFNPLANSRLNDNSPSTPVMSKKLSFSTANTPNTPGSSKRVKIALKHNTSQNPAEYIQQIKSSPNIPFDAKKRPGKGLLKPNAMPSPINPFYKKKIGLKLLNDTI